jgi:hypothetical protein
MQERSATAEEYPRGHTTVRRRVAAVTTGAALAMGMLAAPAAAHGPPAHTHALLLHAVWEGSGPSTEIHSYERCVDVANGRTLPNHVHHDTVHEGRAGAALNHAGHLVVPFATCAGFVDD